jgi:hypothetical protein
MSDTSIAISRVNTPGTTIAEELQQALEEHAVDACTLALARRRIALLRSATLAR